MTSIKIAILTVAAVVSTFASTLQAQTRPVFVSNGTKRNSYWTSAQLTSSFFPTAPSGRTNPFQRAMIKGDSFRTFTMGSDYIRFRPRVFIILPGDTVTVGSDDPQGIDTLYIYGVLNMGSNTGDIEMYNYTSGSTNNAGRTGGINYNTNTRARRGVVMLMTNGRIIGGSSGTKFQWDNNSNADIEGPYNLTGARMAQNVSSANTNNTTRFVAFVPNFLPLPVDLASFNVNTTDNGHEISWTAVGESNRNNFILEISSNGRDFTQVAEIAGNPEASRQNYTYLLNRQDRAFFVRLSETNTTGYANVLATKYVTLNTAAIASCSVFPTVVAASEELNLMFSEINSYQVQVINYNGVSFINSTIETATENEVSRLELTNLPAGQYLVKVYSPSGFAKTEKIIITE